MAESKDSEDLLGNMDLGELGDLGDVEELSDADLNALFHEDMSAEIVTSEFDGLMDLSDFEELGASANIESMNDLLEIDSDWATGAEESTLESDPFIDIEDLNLEPAQIQNAEEIVSEQEKTQPVQESTAADHLGNLDDMMPSDDLLADLPFKDEAGVLEEEQGADIVGVSMESGLEAEDVNQELMLDVPELDEKKEKKTFMEKKEKSVKAVKDENGTIWQRLFGNVPDENAEKNAAKEAKRQAEKEAKKASKKTKEEIALEKQEKKKAKEEAAAAKKAVQEAKKAKKEEAKKLKLAEKAAAREARELEEAKEPPTRINRVGAGIVLATFAIIAVVIIVGNNSYAYSQSIAKASSYFGQREYTNAYNEIYGINVKKADEELKEQVMTVMFIEKQLNSFDNYFAMEMYPEALDSLLKGLDKYDKYLEQARSLGVESDLTYVKEKILSELKSAFNLSEKKSYQLLSITDRREYTKAVVAASGAR